MKKKGIWFFSAIVASCILVASMGGVFATWHYSTLPAADMEINSWAQMGIWGVSQLPTENPDADQESALEEIIRHLNNPNSNLNKNFDGRLHGASYWGVFENYAPKNYYGNMDNHFDEDLQMNNAKKVSFIVQVDQTMGIQSKLNDYLEMSVYTTDALKDENGNEKFPSGKKVGDYVQIVYKTTLRRKSLDSDWEVVATQAGEAPLCYYEESRYWLVNFYRIPSFDPNQWRMLL